VAATFDRLLDIASATGSDTLRLVPDTNALIRNADLASYTRSAPATTFAVHLLPTVLSELDDLKDRGKTQELRDKAQGVVRRLKGLRDKGNLATGVNLTKTITVQAEAREVDVRAVLDWLDPSVPDDRLLAAALRLQSDHPAGTVVLVTSDLNLQNKADAVGLPYIETPPTVASLRAALSASVQSPA
jgi:predicted ribonuclease YlaK